MGDPSDQADAPDTGASPRPPTDGRRGRRRVDTRDPRRSRERALKILFQADVRGEPAGDLLASIVDDPRAWAMLDELDPEEAVPASAGRGSPDLGPGVEPADADADAEPHRVAADEARRRKALELDGFTRSLVQGVADHQEEIDALVQRYARRWSVSRMPTIDRNLLRLGTYELSHEVTAPAVVINEVIELAKRLSTEDSGRYVNGVLESVRKHLAGTPPFGSVEDPTTDEPRIEPVVADAVDPADRLADEPAAEPDVEADAGGTGDLAAVDAPEDVVPDGDGPGGDGPGGDGPEAGADGPGGGLDGPTGQQQQLF